MRIPVASINTTNQSAALARLAAMSNNANARMFALELASVNATKSSGSDSPAPQNMTVNSAPKLNTFSPAGTAVPGTTQAGSTGKPSKTGKLGKPTKAPPRKR